MKHNIFLLAAALAFAGTAHAQEGAQRKWWQDIKQNTTFGGYVIGKAAFNDQDLDAKNESHSTFDIRLIRAYVNGKVWDFKYGLQMEMNGVAGGSSEKGPRVVDAWAEWCKFDFLSVKFGQFKRGFTFENPMNPWDIGFGAYSQATDKLAGMNDRTGEHASNGRDLGLQIQGDLFKSKKDGHAFLHYQVGAYNGQGINHADRNDHKDIIGGLWVSPVKDLCIGAFGWAGEYSKDVNGRKVTVDRNRMAFGLKYESRWTVRGEYVTSQGHKISDYQVADDGTTTVQDGGTIHVTDTGTITGGGTIVVQPGGTIINDGKTEIIVVTGNGGTETVSPGQSYTDQPQIYVIAQSDTGGSISPAGKITVNYGGSLTFSIKPQSGYEIENVAVNGIAVGLATFLIIGCFHPRLFCFGGRFYILNFL